MPLVQPKLATEPLNFKAQPCNCNICTKRNGKCIFDGKCSTQCISYKATCTGCYLTYIGFMQCMFKQQIMEHITGARGQEKENMSALVTHMTLAKHWPTLPTKRGCPRTRSGPN
eukprot:15362855-Ditylum_brightwellii.AAC.1